MTNISFVKGWCAAHNKINDKERLRRLCDARANSRRHFARQHYLRLLTNSSLHSEARTWLCSNGLYKELPQGVWAELKTQRCFYANKTRCHLQARPRCCPCLRPNTYHVDNKRDPNLHNHCPRGEKNILITSARNRN